MNNQHGQEDLGAFNVFEMEEHGHIANGPAYRGTFGTPVAYWAFPSLASGYNYHCISAVGTPSMASLWRIIREELNTGTIHYADGNANFDNPLYLMSNASLGVDITQYNYYG